MALYLWKLQIKYFISLFLKNFKQLKPSSTMKKRIFFLSTYLKKLLKMNSWAFSSSFLVHPKAKTYKFLFKSRVHKE